MSRVTYLVDEQGVITNVYHHEIRIGRHAKNVLDGLKDLYRQGQRVLQS